MSHFIPEPRSFVEINRLPAEVKKDLLKATLKVIKYIINNKIFIIEESRKGETVNPCMDVYKANIQYYGSLDKLMLRIVVRGDFQNKDMIGDT